MRLQRGTAAGVLCISLVGGCETLTGPSGNGGLPRNLTVAVGDQGSLVPRLSADDEKSNYRWSVDDPRVVAITAGPGIDCFLQGWCRVGEGHSAKYTALAPGRTTVRVKGSSIDAQVDITVKSAP
jgi:hypothetical protein